MIPYIWDGKTRNWIQVLASDFSIVKAIQYLDWSWQYKKYIVLKDTICIYRNITESQIDELFSKYGNIVQKNILRDKLTGLPRGVAFVRWDNFYSKFS